MPGLARELPGIPAAEVAPDRPRPPETLGEIVGVINPVAGLAATIANPQTLEDQATGYRYGRHRDNLVAERIARVDAYNELIDDIQRATGTRLANPEDDRFWDVTSTPYLADRYGTVANDPVARFEYDVAQLIRGRDDLIGLYERSQRAAMEARADALRRETTDQFQGYVNAGGGGDFDRFVRGLQLTPGLIAGALSTGSPEQMAQLAAGGAGRGMSALERFAAGAFANVVAQGAIEPALIEDAAKMGEQHDAPMIALDFAIAAALGGTLEAAPALGRRESRLRETTALTRPEDVSLFNEPGSGFNVQRDLAGGRAESVVISSHQRDRVTSLDLPQADDIDIDDLISGINHNDRFVRGEEDAPYTSRAPPPKPDAREVEAVARQADDGPTPEAGVREMATMNGRSRPRTFERFQPRDLSFDPETFQYKRATGPQGWNGRLEGVEAWDSQSAGKVVVWERADGRLFVADGHQRTALAQSMEARGQDVQLDGYRYREADGWSAREVRNIAAQKNLRETAGDVFDTATLLRDAPELIDGSVPQRGAEFRTARSLSQLSPEAYAAVRAGEIDAKLGAIIGEVAGDRPEVHEGLVTLFHKNPPATLREAAYIAREATMAHVYRSESAQLSMFGDDLVIAGMQERAVILRHATQQLRRDRRLFELAERNVSALEDAGNVLNREANARRAQSADALLNEIDLLATRHGPVSTLLREITERAAATKQSADLAATQFVNGLVDLLNLRGLQGLMDAADDPPAPRTAPDTIADMGPRLESEARASTLRSAHDIDEEVFAQSMAEVALERAMRGEVGDVIPEDAIGNTPEADLARIEDAAEALGIDADFTEMQVAAAILARPDAAMEAEARARLMPKAENDLDGGEPPPDTFADVAEQNAAIDPPWMPADFDDPAKLREAIAKATLPELDAVARAQGLGGVARTRAEYEVVLAIAETGPAPARDGSGGGRTGSVPRRSELDRMVAQARRERPDAHPEDVGAIRWVQDSDGNYHVGHALDVDHYAMLEKLKREGIDIPGQTQENRHLRGHFFRDENGQWRSTDMNGQDGPLPARPLPDGGGGPTTARAGGEGAQTDQLLPLTQQLNPTRNAPDGGTMHDLARASQAQLREEADAVQRIVDDLKDCQ